MEGTLDCHTRVQLAAYEMNRDAATCFFDRPVVQRMKALNDCLGRLAAYYPPSGWTTNALVREVTPR